MDIIINQRIPTAILALKIIVSNHDFSYYSINDEPEFILRMCIVLSSGSHNILSTLKYIEMTFFLNCFPVQSIASLRLRLPNNIYIQKVF